MAMAPAMGRPVVGVIGCRPLYARALGALLADSGAVEVVGVAADGDQVALLLTTHRVDAIVIDAADANGLGELVARVCDFDEFPRLVLVGADRAHHHYLAPEIARASAIVAPAAGVDPILMAVSVVSSGGGQSLAGAANGNGNHPALTAEEKAVLRAVTGGLSNPEMAAELAMSLATVKRRLHSICAKLGAGGRAQVAALATRLGLVQEDGT
jgi:DNA-binding NarL/FixJ family response regulator